MKLIADIHIHSPYSRAVSKRLSPASLDRWARIKGIGLLGSGDCTHGKWLGELRDNFDDAGDGLYCLKKQTRSSFDAGPALIEGLPAPAPELSVLPVHFILSGEISTIYKKDGKTRKVHHIVALPDFRAAANFNAKLERLGNIHSDGRPILGLDSAELLSLLLETDERAFLVPAHIWTPWFSVLGAKSGFDSLEECYGSLSSHIPAVETGLSSNPPMNWALSSLDKYSIISNSDAHSPDKLGREATILEMELSFDSLREALRGPVSRGNPKDSAAGLRPAGILGTVEFFPQEGKYHYDGHRNCNVCLDPEEALRLNGVCPVCGKELTRGVMGRVLELADRPETFGLFSKPMRASGFLRKPVDESAPCPETQFANRRPYYSLIPLKEILGELLETGGASKKVEAAYGTLIEKAGNEFSILLDMGINKIEKLRCPGLSGELLAKAIDRMRRGEVSIKAGYDGEYGVIRTFAPGESKESGRSLFEDKAVPVKKVSAAPGKAKKPRPLKKPEGNSEKTSDIPAFSFDENQLAAINSGAKESLIIAGPGTGKTAVLAAKIARYIQEGTAPASILALSFTVKAAAELRERIINTVKLPPGQGGASPQVSTFHSLCALILREQYAAAGLPADFRILGEGEKDAILAEVCGTGQSPKRLGDYIEVQKRFLLLPKEKAEDLEGILPPGLLSFIPKKTKDSEDNTIPEALYKKYRDTLRSRGLVDYDGLIAGTVRLLAKREDILRDYRQKFRRVFVDEYQDINFAQYALIRLLVPATEDSPSLCIIGDPNQAIYGFRGSDKTFIDRFSSDYPKANRFELRKSFRCAEPIIEAAGRLARTNLAGVKETTAVSLFRREYPTDKSEAEGIARIIASLTGGTSFFAIDSGVVRGEEGSAGPGDCAVLVRAGPMAEPIVNALTNHGIPFEQSGASLWWEEEPAKTLLASLREHRTFSSLPETGDEAVREAAEQLKRLADLFGSVEALLDGLAAANGIPEIPGQGVRVMTIHASKGLEFDHVFVPGLEEGILPFTLYAHSDIEEEKRLLYVAMTRARRGLWLSRAASRNFRGRLLKAPPSRFLSELENLIPLMAEERAFKRDAQMTLF